MSDLTLTLYGTLGCHLCDKAKEPVWAVLSELGGRLREVDIAESDALMARYGTRIPVLGDDDGGSELDWPFSADDIRRWLNAS